jgi:hypothetical protein
MKLATYYSIWICPVAVLFSTAAMKLMFTFFLGA